MWEDSDVGEVEPEEVEGADEEEECDWLCVQERMQHLARQVEQLQEERRTQEQENQEMENRVSAQRDRVDDQHVELFPDGNWDPAGTRRMPEWRQRQAEDEEGRRKSSSSSLCTGMCRLMRMRTGK